MTEANIVNVKCDFCGKVIECPKDMLNSEKHSCYECFWENPEKMEGMAPGKLHVDFPMEKAEQAIPAMLAGSALETLFPEIWSSRKEELKEMSRRGLAKEMFGEGAMAVAMLMVKLGKEGKLKNFDKK